ncbi:hypothetical protein [Microbacterium sp. HJ5]
MTAVPRPRRSLRRAVGVAATATLIAAGLVSVAAAPAAADVAPLPAEADELLVSRTDQGVSGTPYLTPDGQKVAYVSTAGDLVAGTQPETPNIFLATALQGSGDPFSGAPRLISTPDASLDDEPADDMSYDPVASADGRYIAFVSHATNLVPGGGTPGRASVYVHDVLSGATFRLDAGSEPDGDSFEPDISDDGRYVVFTSEATDLSAGDTNGAPDVFVAALDADGDGTRGDLAITRLLANANVPGGLSQPAISGNGEWIVYTSTVDDPADETLEPGDVPYLFRSHRTGTQTLRLLEGAHDGAVDATGTAFAAIVDQCEGAPVIAGATVDALQSVYATGVGWNLVDRRVGEMWNPVISADGSTIAWSTTQPEYDFDLGGAVPDPLPEPVVRIAHPSWWDASALEVQCAGIMPDETTELGVGDAPSISASGRTIAFGGPTDMTAAERSVTAVDLHTHDGLSVSNTMGELTVPGYVTSVAVSDIPVSAVTDYGAALADAPIYRLPIYRLPIYRLPIYRLPIYRLLIGDSPIYRLGVDDAPIYRLPIYRLPIYRLPIYRLDIPGGWTQLLEPTPFAGDLQQSVTLADVLAWAQETLESSTASTDERDAATLIRSLSIDDVGLDGTGIDALSIASLILGGARLSEVPVAGSGANSERWQALVDAQSLGVEVDDEMVLAELDAAGLDVAQSGIDAVRVNELPLDATMFDELPMAPSGGRPGLFLENTPLGELAVDALGAEAQDALFGEPRTGTLAENAADLLETATVADLAAGAPDSVTFGMLLFSILDSASYPWEQIDPTVIPAGVTTGEAADWGCDGNDRCGRYAQFQFTFDPGPGEPTTFAAPTASIVLPAATRAEGVEAGGSGPGYAAGIDQVYAGPVQTDGSLVRLPLADAAGGTVHAVSVTYSSSRQPGAWSSKAELTSGDLSAHDEIFLDAPQVYYDVADHNRTPEGQWAGTPVVLTEGVVHYEWISPAWMDLDDFGRPIQGPAQDEDWYYVKPPRPGERLVVSSNAADGQIALSLLRPEQTESPLGVASLGDAPGTAVTEQEGRDAASPAESGADAGAPVPGQALVDQAVVGGDGTAIMQASADAADGAENWLVRVTSGNGLASSQLYSLRARYVPEQPEQRCAPWQAPLDVELEDPFEPWPAVTSDPVGSGTNTIYLTDTSRFRAMYGLEATDEVTAAIRALDGTGAVGDATVQGAILSIDTDPAVAAARAALDQQPCSMTARRALSSAINAFVAGETGDAENIASIVIVGGDDIVPFAPVAQHTAQFNEASHAAQLKLTEQLDGSACPADLSEGEIDPCATPLSAAAAGDFILSDDPYGLADAYQSLGGYLYVPTVAVGRLVDSPDQIRGQLDRFRYADGMLDADSALTGGYGAWAELPQLVSENLAWRLGGGDEALPEPWSKDDAESRLFPDDDSDAPRIVSLNTHADERRLLAGVDGAEGGAADEADIIDADDHAPPDVPPADEVFDPNAATSPLDGSLVFMIGCHAGNNLPAAYYGDDATDWADVFSPAGGFVGNTGFGLANNVTTALSERLLALYADWIGVQTEDGAVSSGGALAFAKQSYLGGLGLYTGYDEKVLMQSVYYGIPMYAFEDSTKDLPLPEAPDLQIVEGEDGLSSASLSLTPSFGTVTREDPSGRLVTYVTVGDELPLAAAGQPILPKVVTRIPSSDEAGNVPRGALITGLTSSWSGTVRPAIGDPGIGVEQSGVTKDAIAFPSSFTAISRQDSPAGPVDLLVTTPASVQSAAGGLGRIETFPAMEIEVLYGADDDMVAPVVSSTEQRGAQFSASAYDADGEVVRAVLLVQPGDTAEDDAEREWEAVELVLDPYGTWRGELPSSVSGAYRWILQVVDAAGNVTTDSARGRIHVAGAPAPALGEAGDAVTVTAGERVVRSIPITNVEPGAIVTGTYTLRDENDEERAKGAVTVKPAVDGTVHAVVDLVPDTPGSYRVSVTACGGDLDCGDAAEFALTVKPANTAPTATVSLDGDDVSPASVLTADAAGSDADDDVVTLSYRWLRNGVVLEGETVEMLSLDGIAAPGDVIRVEVVPDDGKTAGHAASAEAVVGDDKPLPTIAVWATSAGETYDEGTWATDDVVVSFTCTGAGVVCPVPETVSSDTAGIRVERSVTDALGRIATAGITVKLDETAPALAPTVSPNPVAVGGAAVAVPAATDLGSGVASQSCDTPSTGTAGSKTVACRATDVAGNSATATASYTVIAASAACRSGSRVVLQPVNPDGSSVFARISGVPVVFRLCDEFGRVVTARGAVTGVTQVSSTPLPKKGPAVNELPLLLPTVKPVYVPLTGLWAGSIGSATLKGGLQYTYRVNLADGTSFTFSFGVK